MNRKEQIYFFKKIVMSLLLSDGLFTLYRWVCADRITCNKALKIALDKIKNINRKQEYINLWNFCKLLNL